MPRLTEAAVAERRVARRAVHLALIEGTLERPEACERCGAPRPDSHHHRGYVEPFQTDVAWLCQSCHAREDGDARPLTPLLALTKSWEDAQRLRLAVTQRGQEDVIALALATEQRLAKDIRKELHAQPVWPWLVDYPGLGGVHVARVIALIGDPRRFPGQPCTEGHIAVPDHAVGDACPRTLCEGTMLAPRTTTGTRALWHYLGLHVVDGRMPKRRKGVKVDWSPDGRTAFLQPGGIAESVVRMRVPVYRDVYDAAKARLIETRTEHSAVGVRTGGPQDGTEAERPTVNAISRGLRPTEETADSLVSDVRHGLRPIDVERIARVIASKAFAGDLLAAMKRAAAGSSLEVASRLGGGSSEREERAL